MTVPGSLVAAPRQTAGAIRTHDLAVAAVLFAAAASIGTVQYNRALRSSHRPFFYQSYFEPAVMTACGRGFLVAPPGQQPESLRAFLGERVDRFSCNQLPADLRVGTEGLYQRPWRYLLTSVALAWSILGISWSGLGPLFGVFLGSTVVLTYALCRLALGAAAAAVCAAVIAVSPLQLSNLPNLRDYAKAPFTIALLVLLVSLVVRPWRSRDILLLSLAYGLVLGIGYGFRTDLLIDIPPFLVTVALFLPGGVTRHLAIKGAAAALCAAAFVVAAWPIISTVVERGGCQWHVFLLGLAEPFDEALGVRGGSYGWGHLYKDEYVWANVTAYAGRLQPDAPFIEYCSHEYDIASFAFLRDIVGRFPADMLTRAYASAIHVVDIPFARLRLPAWLGLASAFAFVAAVSMTSMRVAAFAVFALIYFGGYPAIQFLPRHYFPFEIAGWVVLAFLIEQAFRRVRAPVGAHPSPSWPSSWRQPVTVAGAILVIVAAPLWALRAYQNGRVRSLLTGYAAAPTTQVPTATVGPGRYRIVPPPAKPRSTADALATLGRERGRFLEVSIDSRTCRSDTSITFVYDRSHPEIDFTRTVPLQSSGASGLTRLFEPVYSAFTGLDVSDPSCVPRMAVVDAASTPALSLQTQLAPGWETQPQYQRIYQIR